MTATTDPHKTKETHGKAAGDEDFPVASMVLPAKARRHIMAFYRFARAADDIADAADLDPARKLAHLDALESTLLGATAAKTGEFDVSTAINLRNSLKKCGVTSRHAQDLLTAFRGDAENKNCHTWDDLINYCAVSAAPVGRYLLDLMGEDTQRARPASDALCAALQITNHLQDCQADFELLGRVYLPLEWLNEMNVTPQKLSAPYAAPELRQIIDRALDETDHLIEQAWELPGLIVDWRLRVQAAVSVACAQRLAHRLRHEDPLATSVRLTGLDKLRCAVTGVIRGLQR